MADESKVQFNLHNVHYALVTADGYAAPVAVPGAVSLTLDPQGDTSTFYADGLAYYVAIANNGYSGTLEMARFPDKMLQEVWGLSLDTNMVLTENAMSEPAAFALLFEIDGDADHGLYAYYNCKAARPSVSAETTSAQKTPKTQSASITASPKDDGKIRARTTSATPAEIRTNWFKSVYTGG